MFIVKKLGDMGKEEEKNKIIHNPLIQTNNCC